MKPLRSLKTFNLRKLFNVLESELSAIFLAAKLFVELFTYSVQKCFIYLLCQMKNHVPLITFRPGAWF